MCQPSRKQVKIPIFACFSVIHLLDGFSLPERIEEQGQCRLPPAHSTSCRATLLPHLDLFPSSNTMSGAAGSVAHPGASLRRDTPMTFVMPESRGISLPKSPLHFYTF